MGFHALSAEIDSLCQELISALCEGHVNPRICMILNPCSARVCINYWPILEFEGSICRTPNPATGYGKKWSKPGSHNRTYQISHYFPIILPLWSNILAERFWKIRGTMKISNEENTKLETKVW